METLPEVFIIVINMIAIVCIKGYVNKTTPFLLAVSSITSPILTCSRNRAHLKNILSR
jgi:hypothetical protein